MTQRYPAVGSATEATHCVNIVGRRARESVTRHSDTSVIRNAGRRVQRLHEKNNKRQAMTEEVDPGNRTAICGIKIGVDAMVKERNIRQR